MNSQGFNFGIDWLEVNIVCKDEIHNKIIEPGRFKSFPQFRGFELNLLSTKTPHYKYVVEILDNGLHIATLCYMPHSKILRENSGTLRIQNWVLYKGFYKDILIGLLTCFELEFTSFSRLDICYDFLHFNNNYGCVDFIKDFAAERIEKKGKAKFFIAGETKAKNFFHALKFGGNLSICTYTLYNKSKEMQDKVFKQYILDVWLSNGYDMTQDVFRLEFSIKNTSNNLVNSDTGEIYSMQDIVLINEKDYKALYELLFAKHFQFIAATKDKQKSRHDSINLLDFTHEKSKRIYNKNEANSARANKIFINKIDDIITELRNNNPKLRWDYQNIAHNLLITHNLTAWWKKKKSMKDKANGVINVGLDSDVDIDIDYDLLKLCSLDLKDLE